MADFLKINQMLLWWQQYLPPVFYQPMTLLTWMYIKSSWMGYDYYQCSVKNIFHCVLFPAESPQIMTPWQNLVGFAMLPSWHDMVKTLLVLPWCLSMLSNHFGLSWLPTLRGRDWLLIPPARQRRQPSQASYQGVVVFPALFVHRRKICFGEDWNTCCFMADFLKIIGCCPVDSCIFLLFSPADDTFVVNQIRIMIIVNLAILCKSWLLDFKLPRAGEQHVQVAVLCDKGRQSLPISGSRVCGGHRTAAQVEVRAGLSLSSWSYLYSESLYPSMYWHM